MSPLLRFKINQILKKLNYSSLPASCDLWDLLQLWVGDGMYFSATRQLMAICLSDCQSQNKAACFVQLASAFYRNQQTHSGPMKAGWHDAKRVPLHKSSRISAFTYTSAAVSLIHVLISLL